MDGMLNFILQTRDSCSPYDVKDAPCDASSKFPSKPNQIKLSFFQADPGPPVARLGCIREDSSNQEFYFQPNCFRNYEAPYHSITPSWDLPDKVAI